MADSTNITSALDRAGNGALGKANGNRSKVWTLANRKVGPVAH